VDGLSLTVQKGELYVMLGPNGAGKTTTLKLVTGLVNPDRGEVYVLGRQVRQWLESGKVPFSFVPEEPFLYNRLSAGEFLRFAGVLGGVSEDRLAERIDRYSRMLGLSDFLDASALTYSHGMRQRTAIAAAMITGPELVVIDEPLVGLDPQSARALKDLLRETVSAGRAVLISTHTLSVAEEIADRIGIVRNGKLVMEGTPEEVVQNAPSLEAAFLDITSQNVDEDQ
jgi:ABC-2 type transport system ATP-binding protein